MQVVNDVVSTDGDVWSATAGGVLRYNRETGRYSRFTRLDGLAGNGVLSAAADEDGNLWFGTDRGGLSKFLAGEGRFRDPIAEFRDLRLNALAVADDRVYVASNIGVSAYLIGVERVKESYRQFGSYPRDTEVTALAVHEGVIWAGTTEGMAWADLSEPNLQDPQVWSTDATVGKVADIVAVGAHVFCAGEFRVWRWDSAGIARTAVGQVSGTPTTLGVLDGRVVAANSDNVLFQRSEDGGWVRLTGLARTIVTLSDSGPSSELWIGTDQGLDVLRAKKPPALRDPPANHFYEMALADGGNLWIASAPNDGTVPPRGVFQLAGRDWISHNRDTGMPSNVAVAFEFGPAGQLWVGTWGHGLAILNDRRRWSHLNQNDSVLRGISVPEAPTFVVVSDIERDSQGLMWLANIQAGLAVMDGFPARSSHLYDQALLGLAPGRNIGKLAIGPDDLKWIATADDGLIMFDDGGTPFTEGDEFVYTINTTLDSRLGSDRITAIFVDEAGVVWIGTDNGLRRITVQYDRDARDLAIRSWRLYGLDNGLLSSIVTDIEADTEGNIWVGTKGGLTQVKASGPLVFTYTAENSGLIDSQVESLLFDPAVGQLWVGTFDGLARLQITSAAVSGGAEATVYPNPFPMSPGATPLSITGLMPGAAVTIFAIDGGQVRQLEAAGDGGTVTWDGENDSGSLAASGDLHLRQLGSARPFHIRQVRRDPNRVDSATLLPLP